MFRKLACLALLLAAALPASAQQGRKALLVMRELDDGLRSATALRQALQLQKSGAEVRLLFESEGVLLFLMPRRGEPLPPPPEHLIEEDGRLLTRKEIDERVSKGGMAFARPQRQVFSEDMAAYRQKEEKERKLRVVTVQKDPRRSSNDKNVLYKRWRPDAEAGGADPYEFGDTDALALAEKALPYQICSYSAEVFGVYDELKAAGRPLTPDRDAPADLAAYLKEGYEIYVY